MCMSQDKFISYIVFLSSLWLFLLVLGIVAFWVFIHLGSGDRLLGKIGDNMEDANGATHSMQEKR